MKITNQQLHDRQCLPLDIKIEMSKRRIKEWYEYWNGQVYVSFSGGKDSTVLLHLVRSIYSEVEAVFVDTGLEYPEIREFVKTIDNVTWLRPKTPFNQIIEKWGYPMISKEQSQYIYDAKNTKSDKQRDIRLNGNKWGMGKVSNKWKHLIDSDIKISDKCCNYLKKQPIYIYEKLTAKKGLLGIMTEESIHRKKEYLKTGCNSFNSKRPLSRPISFWTEEDIWNYIKQFNVPYSKIYDMGYTRTGCMFCMFGVHLESSPNRFELMKETHPKLYDYCINTLNLKQCLDCINVKY